jgi:hypothetical protein
VPERELTFKSDALSQLLGDSLFGAEFSKELERATRKKSFDALAPSD